MNTKEKYMLEALRLFSEKGYDSVGVTEIASAVGCTTSALYKHFPNKKALFDAIVEKSKTEFRDKMMHIHGMEVSEKDFRSYVLNMTVDKQVEMMENLFLALTEDNAPKYFRKLVRMEQSKLPELIDIYMEGYMGQLLRYFESIMDIWTNGGRFGLYDSKVLALQYVSPLLSMVELCDMDPDRKESCLEILRKHIMTFHLLAKI